MSDTGLIYESGAASDVGKVRKVNEDSLLVRPTVGLWCVSDGMGGHDAGRLASNLIVEMLASIEPQATAAGLLEEAMHRLGHANFRLRRVAVDRSFEVVGATVVVLLVHGTNYACLWSGDSRIYRVRGGVLTQLTRDHSEAEELVQRGIMTRAEVKHWPRRNVITRAIGVGDEPEVEIVDGVVEPGDTFVLCSDGLTNHVDDDEIARAITSFDVQTACDRLVATTLDRGAKDNVTVVAATIRKREPTVLDPAGNARVNWDAG
jgi:protein phosphatase